MNATYAALLLYCLIWLQPIVDSGKDAGSWVSVGRLQCLQVLLFVL